MNRGLFSDVDLTPRFENASHLLARLSFEEGVIDYVSSVFNNIVPAAMSKVGGILSSLSDTNNDSETVKELNSIYPTLETKLAHLSFTAYSKLVVTIPEGYEGYLVDNLKAMNELLGDVYKEGFAVLSEYKTLLALYVSNKDYRNAMRDHTAFFKATAKKHEALVKRLGNVFPSSKPQSRTYLAKLVQNFGQVKLVTELTTRLDKQNNQQNLPEFMKEVRRCVELLDILHESFQKQTGSNMSKEAAMNISEGAYVVARFVEFVSMFRFRTEQLSACSLGLVKQLNTLN